MEDHQRCEKDTHYVTLNSIKEYKIRQRQQGKMDRDEVYKRMSQNLERGREVARSTFSRASTISAEEHQMDSLYQNWQVEYKRSYYIRAM